MTNIVVSEHVRTGMEDEVTRVESVTELRGVSGHGAASTLFLSLRAAFAVVGQWGAATLTLIVAYGVAANGLSMYAWDEVRARVRATADDAESDRKLTVHRLSPETKADLLGGLVIAVGFVAVVTVVTVGFRYVGLGGRTAVVLAGSALAVGNVGALLQQYLT